jgi:hypothetical protein
MAQETYMKSFSAYLVLLLFITFFVHPIYAQAPKKPTTAQDELSYALGMDVGKALKKDSGVRS